VHFQYNAYMEEIQHKREIVAEKGLQVAKAAVK
jgi:hypothetical protein